MRYCVTQQVHLDDAGLHLGTEFLAPALPPHKPRFAFDCVMKQFCQLYFSAMYCFAVGARCQGGAEVGLSTRAVFTTRPPERMTLSLVTAFDWEYKVERSARARARAVRPHHSLIDTKVSPAKTCISYSGQVPVSHCHCGPSTPLLCTIPIL